MNSGKIDGEFKRLLGDNSVKKIDALAFYKLLMTTSNLHSTLHSFYSLIDEDSLANYHYGLSKRFLSDANKLKSLKLNDIITDNKRKDQ